jgi:hypothetical protein
VRIRFRARGAFKIAPADVTVEPDLQTFPALPVPPQESYLSSRGNPVGKITAVQPISPFTHLPRVAPSLSNRDEEAWYYEPERPKAPVDQYDLVCRRFRHGGEEETFELHVFPSAQQDVVAGALEVEVNASNLPEPLLQRFPLEIHTQFGPSDEIITVYLEGQDPIASALGKA